MAKVVATVCRMCFRYLPCVVSELGAAPNRTVTFVLRIIDNEGDVQKEWISGDVSGYVQVLFLLSLAPTLYCIDAGNTANLLRIGPESASKLVLYDRLKHKLEHVTRIVFGPCTHIQHHVRRN